MLLADKYIAHTGYVKNRNMDSQETLIQTLKRENKELKAVILSTLYSLFSKFE